MTPDRRQHTRRNGERVTVVERLIVVITLTVVRLAIVGAIVYLGIHHIISGESITAIFSVIVGGSGATIAYKLGSGR